ncbi:uncharacterized protein EI97DRAFT_476301 [Westerdykella ornata]|uniref:Uncharacterized protein n=1 Tax=Westerdykella ornata TaxID=318751 RepID=A0A6A6JEU0_WESOR|nr:uncharacterized protein EI97DRAFT_476301 [Westerdykella ornata]KAF2274785.1 hypothetical protein EI97DRAFT_476301 [Westerdykella ornata]
MCIFGPFVSTYSFHLTEFLHSCQGLLSITKRDFWQLFRAAWDSTLTKTTILKAFEATGLAPFNLERILTWFQARQDEHPSSSSSSSSVLSASDWRKIETLLWEVVEDIYDSKAVKLSHTIHTIAAQKIILKHEVKQLCEALHNEKKCYKRGKALLLELPEDYNSGAIFWSPSKVQKAHDRQIEKDAEEKAVQLQKDEDSKWREELKLQKAALLEERRCERAAAKIEQAQACEQKALQAQELWKA